MRRLFATLLCCLVAFATGASAEQHNRNGKPFRVFIANSYDADYFWSARQQAGILAGLQGLEVEVMERFMDTKRNPSPEWLEKSAAQTISAIEKFAPDILFTGDDNASRTVGKHFMGSELPVVFYGVNAEPEEYGLVSPGRRATPDHNVTGVLERHFFAEGVDLLQTVCQSNQCGVKRLYLITDDSYTSKKLFTYLKGVDWDTPMEVHFLEPVSTFAKYKEEMAALNQPGNGVFIYNLQTITDEQGRFLPYPVIMEWTREMLTIPSVAFHEGYIREGALMGLLVSGFSQAFNAGLKGQKILTGTPVAEVPIDSPTKGRLTVNATTMHKLGMKIPLSLLLSATVHTN